MARSFSNPFIALRHKNFRRYLIGMTVSMIGSWMQSVAQPWLAYSLTNSPFRISLVSALQYTPVLILSLFAGVIIDRFPKRIILILTQAASLVIVLILAVLVWLGRIEYWHIIVLSTLLGVVTAFDMPTRHAYIIELVSKEDVMNAVALNSTVFNLSRIVGPALAGVIMAYAGISLCFFLNALSFAVVLASLFFIRPVVLQKVQVLSAGMLSNIGEGLRYIRRNKTLFSTFLVLAIVGTFAPNFNVLIPVLSKEVLGQGEAGYGLLMSALGAGSLFGAVYIATQSRTGPRRFFLYAVPLIVGACLIFTGYAGSYAVTALLLVVTGFFFVAYTSSANSATQLSTTDEYRGRVMSVYSLIFAGSTPIGNLYAGAFAEGVDARAGFAACGIIVVALMLPVLWRERKRAGEPARR